jgi:type IV secretion system protein VirB7
MMRLGLILSILCLAGCATQNDAKPAVCDGKHRRPANPYGSVLPSAPAAPGKAPDAAKVGPLSSADPQSFQPCGADG